MVSRVRTFTFEGIDVVDVDVQVRVSSGTVAFIIVGLPDKAVAESRERVRSALAAIGMGMPAKRVTVNLSPADLVKEGSHFDLPIALGLLAEMKAIPNDVLADYYALGELSLDGNIEPVNGVIPAAVGAKARNKGIICPKANGKEAKWAGDNEVLAPKHLLSLVNHFKGTQLLNSSLHEEFEDFIEEERRDYPDMAEIIGQESAKRAIEIAAAGGHNMLMLGPPGAGKSMLAKSIKGILPNLNSRQILEVSMIKSITGNIKNGRLSALPPFRDPHHSCSLPAMVGGGTKAKPGEITLAHNGVLFLDELPEFPRNLLESMRQPLENGNVTVSRVQSHITYPASFQLIAAMNPCRCGYLGDASKTCSRAPVCGAEYQSRISGPFFDRIDITIDMPAVEVRKLIYNKGKEEPSKDIAARVLAARKIQQTRYQDTKNNVNAKASSEMLTKVTDLDKESLEFITKAIEKMGISMRSYNKVLRVARTIADLEKSEGLMKHHLAEALGYQRHKI